ncbi:MAG: sugar phosphate isomerase/epimerase family protein, partial [Spirochaetota bacterium]
MARPVTLFTGQWADLPFTEICEKAGSWGFDGLELCTWGDHFDVNKAAADSSYVEQHKATLSKNGLGCWSIGSHIVGQLVGDNPDPRNDAFAPERLAGKPAEIQKWAIDEMMATAAGAKAFGLDVVTGFMGSPIWAWWYSFPPTTEQQIADGYGRIVELWGPIFDEFDRHGVRFALEVHPGEIAYDLYTTQRLIEAFGGRKTLGVNFDPSHLIWQGIKPELFYRDPQSAKSTPSFESFPHLREYVKTCEAAFNEAYDEITGGNPATGYHFEDRADAETIETARELSTG